MNTIRQFLSLVVPFALIACIAPAGPPNGKYSVSGTAIGSAVTPRADACVFGAWIPLDTPFAGHWKGTTTVGFGRLALRNGEHVKRDTNFHDHLAELTEHGLDTIILELTGPINVTLSAVRDDAYSFTGDWVCDGKFPFSDDSSAPNPGRWGVLTY